MARSIKKLQHDINTYNKTTILQLGICSITITHKDNKKIANSL